MTKLKVLNFGPISTGFDENDGYISINKFTFFYWGAGKRKKYFSKTSFNFYMAGKIYSTKVNKRNFFGYFRIQNFTTLSLKEKELARSVIFESFKDRQEIAIELIDKLNALIISGIESQFTDENIIALKRTTGFMFNSSLFMIVEEPEQNLYPTSQIKILEELIKITNSERSNKVVITTHSPFVISAVNNYIYAAHTKKDVSSVMPELFKIDFNLLNAYFLSDGKIRSLKSFEPDMIDTEKFDSCASELNSIYDRLYDIKHNE